MKLWEKNYLVTFISLAVAVNLGVFFLAAFAFHSDLKAFVKAASMEEKSLSYTINSFYSMELTSSMLLPVLEKYRINGAETMLWDESRLVAGNLKDEQLQEGAGEGVRIVRSGGEKVLCIQEQIDTGGKSLRLVFVKELSSVYQAQNRRVGVFLLLSLCLTAMFGAGLFVIMRNLYRPIENIAHELRTPLTGIKGYAQYLMIARLSEEERYFATEQILSGSNQLQNIVEKLLIMGNLREGQLKRERVALESIFTQLKPLYPSVLFSETDLSVNGDPILLKSLFSNLIHNAVREGSGVTVTVLSSGAIQVHNDGQAIEPDLLRRLNRGAALPPEMIHGSGKGLRLCHEIARLHNGKLTFASGEEGTDVTVFFDIG